MTRRRQPIGRRLRPLRVGGVGFFAVFLSACIEDAPLDSLDPQGPFARRIDDLFWLVFWIAVGIFVLVQAALVVAVVVSTVERHRSRVRSTGARSWRWCGPSSRR